MMSDSKKPRIRWPQIDFEPLRSAIGRMTSTCLFYLTKAWSSPKVLTSAAWFVVLIFLMALAVTHFSSREMNLRRSFNSPVIASALSSDGRYSAVSHESGWFQLWDHQQKKAVIERPLYRNRVQQMVFHEDLAKDGRAPLVVAFANGKVRLDDMATGRILARPPGPNFSFAPLLSYDPTEALVLLAGQTADGLRTGSLDRADFTPSRDEEETSLSAERLEQFWPVWVGQTPFNLASTRPDGASMRNETTLELEDGIGRQCYQDRFLQAQDEASIWVATNYNGLCRYAVNTSEAESSSLEIAIDINGTGWGEVTAALFIRSDFSSTGSIDRALVGYANGVAVLFDLLNDRPIALYDGHRGAIRTLSVSADQTRAFIGAEDGSVQFVSLTSPQLFGRLTLLVHPLFVSDGNACDRILREVVFFEYDRNQSDEARNTLSRVLSRVGQCQIMSVSLVGHTDRERPAAYNLSLSERMVSSVRQEAERLGISPSIISSEGLGETQPLVATENGVREQMNRRVEIEITLMSITPGSAP